MSEQQPQGARGQGTLQRIRLEDLKPDPGQPRQNVKEDEELRQLADSLKHHGQQYPVIVWRDITDMKYAVDDGHRRLAAARLAGLAALDCLVKAPPADLKERRTRQLVANIHRADLPPMDQARAMQELAELYGLNKTELADFLNKDRSTVSRLLALLRLPPEAQKKVADGQTSARAVTRKPGPAFRERHALGKGLTFTVEASRKRVDLDDIMAACDELKELCRAKQKPRKAGPEAEAA
jgi:ParB/RepB/Spo0J family partition protein